MKFYLLLFVLIFIIYFLVFFRKEKNLKGQKKIFLLLSFSLLFFVMGFRTEDVGTDTKLYCDIFDNIKSMSFVDIFNSGDSSIIYVLYNKFISLISSKRNIIIISNSFIICFLTALFIYNNGKNVFLPTILFMCFYHFFSAMNISRQYIAVMLVANSIYFLKRDQKKLFILICLGATLIHNTAIISFILYPLFYIKLNKKNIFIYLLIIFNLLFFLDRFIFIFSSIFPHYAMYFQNDFLTEVGKNRKIIITMIYIFFEIIMLILVKNKQNNLEEYKTINIYIIINALAIILGIVSLKVMLFSRMEIYFSIFAIIYIPYILSFFKEKIILTFFLIIIMTIPMLIQLNSNNGEVLPYKNMFFIKNYDLWSD